MHSDKKFYITTPIYYVNARPHIGHAYSTIVADVIARRHRLLGEDTFFLTGTDEHGQKIERSAAAAGIPPQEFADQVSKTFSDLWKRMGITNDDFIRTTEPRHKQGVQKLFAALLANGAIKEGTYTGQYCVSDEAYVEVGPGEPCPDCGRITETISESNYYFKLSKYQKDLIELIEPGQDGAKGQLDIQPATRRNEVLGFLRGNTFLASISDEPVGARVNLLEEDAVTLGKLAKSKGGTTYVPGALKDLSISRTSFKWGIPVPGDESHVIYVWLDALANYMTAVGYPDTKNEKWKYWPANLHLVGKEIIRFHCVYWPAFLMALRPPTATEADDNQWIEQDKKAEDEWNDKWLPKSVVANGWLLFEESKMSKSRGNVVRTETILDAFGTLCPATPVAMPPNPALLKGTASAVPQTSPTKQSALAAEVPSSPEAPQPPTKQQQDLFATDVLRYFLLREIPFGQDGSFSFDAMVTRYNADLANGYGNLVSRTIGLIVQNFSSRYIGDAARGTARVPPLTVGNDTRAIIYGYNLRAHAETLIGFDETESEYGFSSKLQRIFDLIQKVDVFINEEKPWKIAAFLRSATETHYPDSKAQSDYESDIREELIKLECILYTAAESIRIITALLYPILPYATAQVWSQLGLGDIEKDARDGKLKDLKWGGLKPGTKLGPLSPIFPRAPKELIQTMIDTEEQNAQAAKPQTSLIDEAAPTAAENHPSTDPAAAPRTSSLPIENPGTHVAGSAAITTERPGTPPHTEAPASAPFANAAAASNIPDTPQIAIDDFVKIDLRVAKIIVAERIPKADKLLRLEVDLGYEKRQILSGIAEWYKPEELVGRNIVVIANLAPRKMRGLESHGMLLAASHGENGKPVLATFGEEILLGSRVR